MGYDAVQELRELASHNIVAALKAHTTEVGAKFETINDKLELHKAETAAKFGVVNRKLDLLKAETGAKLDAMAHKMDTWISEIVSMRRTILVAGTLVGLLITLVGLLGGLGLFKLISETGAATAGGAAPAAAVPVSEPVPAAAGPPTSDPPR